MHSFGLISRYTTRIDTSMLMCWFYSSHVYRSVDINPLSPGWCGFDFKLVIVKPLSEPRLEYFKLDPWEQTSVKFQSKFKHFHWRKYVWKCRLRNVVHFVSASMTTLNCKLALEGQTKVWRIPCQCHCCLWLCPGACVTNSKRLFS